MGDTGRNIEISVFQKAKERLEMETKRHEKKVIVNAGLLKAGKSTLFNALAGSEVFASDVVRATTENGTIEQEKYFLVDTPGLDAGEKDTQTAVEGYQTADAIIFVHNIQEGELNQIEIDSIRQISSLFGSSRDFFENTILVLTHKDQAGDSCADIEKCIEKQCESIFGNWFGGCFCVDSPGYLKGIAEHKELLKQESGVDELLRAIESDVLQPANLQAAKFEKDKDLLLAEMKEALESLRETVPQEEASRIPDMQRAEKEIQRMLTEAAKAVQERGVDLTRARASYYNAYNFASNHKDYDSEYSAKSAGKEAVANAISRIAQQAKRDALNIVEQADAHINPAQIPKGMVDSLSEEYEKVRQYACHNGMTIQAGFTVTLQNPSEISAKDMEEARKELGYARENARLIRKDSFSSPSSYAEKHSSNLDIDQRTSYKTVKNLFGNYRNKEVSVYVYNVQGALDDLAEDAGDRVGEIREQASGAVRAVFEKMKEDLEKQFRDLAEEILGEVSLQIKEAEKKEKECRLEREKAENAIAELESCMQDVEDIRW